MNKLNLIILFAIFLHFNPNADNLSLFPQNKLIEINNYCIDSTLYIVNNFSGQYIHYNNKEFIATTINLKFPQEIAKYPEVKEEYNKYKTNRKYFWLTFFGGLGLMVLAPPISLYSKFNMELWPFLLVGGTVVMSSSIIFEIKSQNNMNKLIWKLNNNLIMNKINNLNKMP